MNKCWRTWEWHSIAINIMYFNFLFLFRRLFQMIKIFEP